MEIFYNDFEAQARWCHRVMTSSEKVYEDKFLRIVSDSYELHSFAKSLTLDIDLFVEIIKDEVGFNRFMRILGRSDDINTILFYPIMIRFYEIMTHHHGKDLASRVLDVCNIHQKTMFYQIMYRHGLVNGCTTLMKAIPIADDLFNSGLLELVEWNAPFDESFEADTRWCHKVMTSSEKVYEDKFLRIVSDLYELHRFASSLTLDINLFVEIVRDEVGVKRVMKILGISDDINTILLYPIMIRFWEIMTHQHGKDLASRVLDVCNIDVKNMFCQITYRHGYALARDENGCSTLKKAITIADDLYKSDLLERIVWNAHELLEDDLGISLIQHVLNLDYTQKTTQDNSRLHELLAEFDEILPACDDTVEILMLALKLTSDADLFVEFVKTERGMLMVQIVLGKSEEIDTMFWEAIKRSYTDLASFCHGHLIMLRTINVSKKRDNLEVVKEYLHLIGYNALYLSKEPNMGNFVVQYAIDLHDSDCTVFIACGLQCHYIELSFLKYGSKIVTMLLAEDIDLPLIFIVMEIVKCDEDTLVRLANDEYGSGVLEKTLQVAQQLRNDLFEDLVDKLDPLLDSLHESRGANVAAIIIDSRSHPIVSQENN